MDLRELWIQYNPIAEIPREIEGCTRLEVIDIRRTKVKEVPAALSTLKKLHEFEWSETPFSSFAKERFNLVENDLKGLRNTLKVIFDRENLDSQLLQFLLENHFARETDTRSNIPVIESFAKVL